jgi:hypothetical protein
MAGQFEKRYLGALRRSVIDPTLRLALISRSLGDRPCAPLAGWRTTPSRIGGAFRSVGCPSDSGPRGSCGHGPRARKAAGSDRSCRTIWCGREGVSRKTTGATQKGISSSKSPAARRGSGTYLNLTTAVSELPHFGHSKVRRSWSGTSGSIFESSIISPHLGQGGFGMEAE